MKKDKADIEKIANSEIENAVNYYESNIYPDQEDALLRYAGELYGTEVDGKSKVCTREVMETVDAMLPSLLRIFTSTDNIVEFQPRKQQDEEVARQATDYVNYIFNVDNNGFDNLQCTIKDGLLQKIGILKSYYEEIEEWAEPEILEGLTEDGMSVLMNDKSIEVLEHDTIKSEVITPEVGIVLPTYYSLKIRRKKTSKDICVDLVAPFEFLVSPDCRGDLDTARFVGQQSLKTQSELVAMGFDKSIVEDLPTQEELENDDKVNARYVTNFTDDPADETEKTILVTEGYVRCDIDGDGIAELVQVYIAGDNGSGKLLSYEEVDYQPFSAWTPIKIPHQLYGFSIADVILDIQQVKTALLRQTLDNLYLTNCPRNVALKGSIDNIDNLLDHTPGGVIQASRPDAVTTLTIPFTAEKSYMMLDYFDNMADKRSGMSGANNLDPDLLRDATATAIQVANSSSQQKIELIARNYANFLEDVFKKILYLTVKYPNSERVIKIRGKWVQIDPRYWDSDMTVAVNVGLGSGTREVQVAMLNEIAKKQEMIMMQLGLNNPLVSLPEYSNTLTKMVEGAGFKHTEQFFKDIPEGWQPPQQPQQESPEVIKAKTQAQIDTMKAQNDIKLQEEKLKADLLMQEQKLQAELELKRAQYEAEFELKTKQLGADIQKEMVSNVRYGGEVG